MAPGLWCAPYSTGKIRWKFNFGLSKRKCESGWLAAYEINADGKVCFYNGELNYAC